MSDFFVAFLIVLALASVANFGGTSGDLSCKSGRFVQIC